MATSVRPHARKRGSIPFLSFPLPLIVLALGGLAVFYLTMRLLAGHSQVDSKLDIDLTNGRILINTHGDKAELVEVIVSGDQKLYVNGQGKIVG